MSRQRMVQAIRSHASRQAAEAANVLQLATVTDTSPLEVTLMEADIDIQEPILTQTVRQYDADHTIDVGDVVAMMRRGGDWLVLAVLSDKSTPSGGPPSGPAGGVLGGSYPNPSFASDMATQAELDAHAGLTTSAHGGIVATTDPRLTDSRAPAGPAGGVLGGNYPNPSFAVDMATQAELDAHAALKTGTHGIPSLSSGQGLLWDGSNWVAASFIKSGDAAGGDLTGTYPNPTQATSQQWKMQQTSSQSIANTTPTHVDYQAAEIDGPVAQIALGANTATITRAGLWLIGFKVMWNANSIGVRMGSFTVNDNGASPTGPWHAQVRIPPTGGSDQTVVNGSEIIRLAVNDVIRGMLYQSSGGSLSTFVGVYDINTLWGVWLSP